MLPASQPGGAYVAVSPIIGGEITLPERFFIDPPKADVSRTVPSLTFLVKHPGVDGKPRLILFDLGLRSCISDYTKAQQDHLKARKPYKLGPGVAQVLREDGYDPSAIDTVILSHVHYDHHGDPDHFPSAQFLVGPGVQRLLQHGLGSIASHQSFSPDLLPQNRITELPSPGDPDKYIWQPLGPFLAVDLLGDKSLFILNSPGHLPGHINLLCRVGLDRWVCLCGDSYHDRRLLTDKFSIATWEDARGDTHCIHHDREAAAVFISGLRELAKEGNVELLGAHDADWVEENRARLFPSTL